MKRYWLNIGAKIHDQAAQAEHGRLWRLIAGKYKARLDPLRVLPIFEETRDTHRVIVEFPFIEDASACYDDPTYRGASRHAQQGSHGQLLILEGELA